MFIFQLSHVIKNLDHYVEMWRSILLVSKVGNHDGTQYKDLTKDKKSKGIREITKGKTPRAIAKKIGRQCDS